MFLRVPKDLGRNRSLLKRPSRNDAMYRKKPCEEMPKMPDTRGMGVGGQRKKKPWWTPECSSGIKITLVVHSHTMLNMHNNNFQMERADTTQLSLDNPPNSKNYYFKALRFCFVLIFETKSHCVAPTGLKCKRFACLCFPNAPWD